MKLSAQLGVASLRQGTSPPRRTSFPYHAIGSATFTGVGFVTDCSFLKKKRRQRHGISSGLPPLPLFRDMLPSEKSRKPM